MLSSLDVNEGVGWSPKVIEKRGLKVLLSRSAFVFGEYPCLSGTVRRDSTPRTRGWKGAYLRTYWRFLRKGGGGGR